VVKLKKYSLEGKEVGQIDIDDQLAQAEANGQMIKDYIVALRANARQWSANTKGRSEVNHSTQKPHPQKGQGRARQGRLSSPQYKGGGRVFGPKPKFDQHVRINKKERRAAIRFLIGEKIRDNRLHIIESTALDAPKTKTIVSFLKENGLEGRRLLFLAEGSFVDLGTEDTPARVSVPNNQHDNFVKSLRNIPKADFALASNISGYDVIRAHELIVTEAALQELQDWLS
jgi:large subunit ribosomal protein L4